MKTNFRFSSKMHLFIIISTLLIAIGLAVGIICEFVAGGFFNYGADWSSYREVTVSYQYVEYGEEEKVTEICEKAFENAEVSSYYVKVSGNTNTGGEITYRFTLSTDAKKLSDAADAINTAFRNGADTLVLSSASAHVGDTVVGGQTALVRMIIALAVIIVFHFGYFAVRYKLSMALAALVADFHNLALFIALIAMTRIPLGSSVFAFAALTVVITVLCSAFAFDKMRKNLKDDAFKKLASDEQVDTSANQSFMLNLLVPACLAVLAVLAFALFSISSMSPLAIISPVLCALACFVACAYGTAFFTPSVYGGIKRLADKMKLSQGSAKDKTSK